MQKGMMISGAAHLALIALALFGDHLFPRRAPIPLVLTEIEVVDGAEFDAAVSSAPVIPNQGPAELAPPAPEDQAAVAVADPDVSPETPESLPTVSDAPEPEAKPDRPQIVFAPPPTVVPTELARPSIAEVPSIESLPRQAATPESPPSTEPLQPLASAPSLPPSPRPTPLREIERVATPEPEPEPEPEEPLKPTETEEIATAEPESEVSHAPQQSALPVARPAELAAAAQASSAPESPPSPSRAEDAEQKPDTAQPSGSTAKFASVVTETEKNALRLGIKQFFTYNGNRSDRQLRVKIEIRLSRDGQIVAGPTQLDATGGNPASQRALFQSGRRALFRAQNAGEFKKLPADRYDGWKLIHITFTPEEIGFS